MMESAAAVPALPSDGELTTFRRLSDLLSHRESAVLAAWTDAHQVRHPLGTLSDDEFCRQSRELLSHLRDGLHNLSPTVADHGQRCDIRAGNWEAVRGILAHAARRGARQGATVSETAAWVLSLKQALFVLLREPALIDDDKSEMPVGKIVNAGALVSDLFPMMELLDQFALFGVEKFQQAREEVIARQQEEMLELSTPVVKLWEGILALPLIGTLDSARTQIVMETLLEAIVDTGSRVAIIDITGVPTVDTLVSQHLLKTVAAARLLGAECIISGIRPQIAQTIIHLGVDLSNVTTTATMAEAIRRALKRAKFA